MCCRVYGEVCYGNRPEEGTPLARVLAAIESMEVGTFENPTYPDPGAFCQALAKKLGCDLVPLIPYLDEIWPLFDEYGLFDAWTDESFLATHSMMREVAQGVYQTRRFPLSYWMPEPPWVYTWDEYEETLPLGPPWDYMWQEGKIVRSPHPWDKYIN